MTFTLFNPYSGEQVRKLQEQLYREVANACDAFRDGNDREAYHMICDAYDIVTILRPGYGESEQGE